MRKLMIVLTSAAALSACGGSSSRGSTASTPSGSTRSGSNGSTTTASRPAGARCRTVPVPAPKGPQHLPAPTLRLNSAKTYAVTIVTNCGAFALTLDVKGSPKTSASFYSLVKGGFFDGLTFHRVAAGFVIQGGDPNGDGTGGPGYTVVEPPPRSTEYVRGDVAMAKTQTDPPGAAGSQFFIVTAANATQSAGLTPDYALLGKVSSGLNVVAAIGSLPTNPGGDGTPSPAVVMSKVTVKAS